MPSAPRRPRLLVLNQYYWPGVEATGQLLAQLAESLTDEFDVRVVTGRLRSHPDAPAAEVRNGVEIVRVDSTAYDRANLLPRAANYATYLLNSLRAGLRGPQPDIVLCMTDPPVVGNVALAVARLRRASVVVISEDVFPEIAVELRRLTNPAVVSALRILVAFYLRRADRIVAIGETMRARLIAKGAPGDRVRVIPNWVDAKKLHPEPKDNEWSREHDLVRRFVVMHSGNVGHAQDLDSLVRAATFLRDLDDLRIVIVGRGARHAELVALAERLEVRDQVVFLNYQPRSTLPLSLSAADVHVVGLARGLAGYVIPSRFYGVLAVGRPVIVAADDAVETARVAADAGCGVVVPPGRPELLAGKIRDAHDGLLDLEGMGRKGRDWVVANADQPVALERYRALLAELVTG